MEERAVRKTFKYKLQTTPAHERALETVLQCCRERSHAGLQERKTAWEQCRVSVHFAMQSAQLPGIKAVRPEYRDLNAQVLQHVLQRLDKTSQAFFRRVRQGEAPGSPRFQGRDRYTRFTYPQVGEHGGAVLDQYDTISLEDVQVRTMVRNHHLAKRSSAAAWAAFRTMLTSKAACAGKRVMAVPPAYTSQDCSGCGERVAKSLAVRTHVCPICGLVLDRDEHAALNILRAGQALQGAVALAAVVN
jgi:IS605 OrfB family transposase